MAAAAARRRPAKRRKVERSKLNYANSSDPDPFPSRFSAFPQRAKGFAEALSRSRGDRHFSLQIVSGGKRTGLENRFRRVPGIRPGARRGRPPAKICSPEPPAATGAAKICKRRSGHLGLRFRASAGRRRRRNPSAWVRPDLRRPSRSGAKESFSRAETGLFQPPLLLQLRAESRQLIEQKAAAYPAVVDLFCGSGGVAARFKLAG